jgi:hypothetical protein
MSAIDDLVDSASPKKSYYIEDSVSTLKPGTYRAVISGLKTKQNVTTRTGVQCDIYWMIYTIEEEHPECGGEDIRDSGIFRFKGDETKRNRFYKKFLESLEIPLKQIKKDGKVYYELPPLLDENVVGKKVQINAFENKWEGKYGVNHEIVAKMTKVLD